MESRGTEPTHFHHAIVMLVRTAEGKAKATVTPDGAPPAFFLRMTMK